MVYVALFFQIVLLVTGQIFWKFAVDSVNAISFKGFLQLICTSNFWLGSFAYLFASLLWFYILKIAKDSFSIVYPLGSLAYVLGVFAAMLVFGEVIPFTRWIGVGFILIGAFLIAR